MWGEPLFGTNGPARPNDTMISQKIFVITVVLTVIFNVLKNGSGVSLPTHLIGHDNNG